MTAFVIVACATGGATPPDDDPEHEHETYVSPGTLTLTGASETTFNSVGSTIVFEVSGATLDTGPGGVLAYRADAPLPASMVQVAPDSITLSGALLPGANGLAVYALDSEGLVLATDITLWGGAATLFVDVVDTAGTPVPGATVTAKLVDDHAVTAQAVSDGTGRAEFTNLPARTVILEARTDANQFGSAGSSSDPTVELMVFGFDPPSAIDNNDFSLGTDGWNLDADGDGISPVELIAHVEGATTSASAASLPQGGGVRSASGSPAPAGEPEVHTLSSPVDLALSTLGEGPQSISRTFEVKPGTKNVTVRYRFITSEVPGGYFGSRFNDFFSVSIRSSAGGGAVSESNSMNGLGLAAFDASGATAWREESLAVSEEGDTIQVDITVANVGDALYDSRVVVDLVDETGLAITQLSLNGMENERLTHLSVSPHTYYDGNTGIHGTITITGDEDDALTEVVLEVLEGGSVRATANLAAAAAALLTNFGADETIQISTSQLLFELASAQTSAIDQTTNGSVVLRVRATAASGSEATAEFGAVTKLVRYAGGNRFGGRDTGNCIEVSPPHPCGGDDWVKPSVRTVVEHFGDILVNDFSNMNGGYFPPHVTHRTGNDVDVRFTGYENRDAAAAAVILGHLNDTTYGPRIRIVGVTFERVESNTFWTAIRDVTLADGRSATSVIQNWPEHTTHFHWHISDD